MTSRITAAALLATWWFMAGTALGQQVLIDRVVARVEGQTITLSDVRAAVGLGLVEGNDATAVEQLIDRQLMVNEVQRFPPPEPSVADVDAEAGRLEAVPGLEGLLAATGIDRRRVRELARETLRVNSYLNQRFGVTVQVSDEEVAAYYRAHPNEFARDGQLMPLAAAEPLARERASAVRRQANIDRWLADLRARASISRPVAPG